MSVTHFLCGQEAETVLSSGHLAQNAESCCCLRPESRVDLEYCAVRHLDSGGTYDGMGKGKKG